MIIMNSIPRTAAELIATVQGMAQACGGRHPSKIAKVMRRRHEL